MFQKQSYALRLLIEKISQRERYLLLATLVALCFLIAEGLLMFTGLNNHELVLDRIAQKKSETERVKQVLVDYQAALNNPKIIALQSANRNLQENLDSLTQRIADINSRLMSPDRMTSLLKELLDKQSQLTIINFSVLPVTTIESNIDGGNLFYQHGLRMELEGEFESLTEYLSQIESLPLQLFWDYLVIETKKFPILTIKLNVHTLSQDEDWLNV